MTHLEIFHGLVAAGMKMRYGDKPDKEALLRCLWEKKHIMDAGFVDEYIMAFTLFRHYAASMEIGYWPRGAVPSSIVCYCLGLTEIDPIKYGLHSVRFVNDQAPKFQFDIEASRYDEFMETAEKVLQSSAAEGYDITAIRECMLQRLKNLTPMEYLSRKQERPLPEDLDDEFARYALSFPDTMDLYETYLRRKNGEAWSPTGIPQLDEILAPTYGILTYQEQMLDILHKPFHTLGYKANHIRRCIQRGDTEQIAAYKAELFADLRRATVDEAEVAWHLLTSNRRAILKSHTVSRVLAMYYYNME